MAHPAKHVWEVREVAWGITHVRSETRAHKVDGIEDHHRGETGDETGQHVLHGGRLFGVAHGNRHHALDKVLQYDIERVRGEAREAGNRIAAPE